MMTQQLGFSILSAPLAAIDRRSLSQAWLSVLGDHRDAATKERTTHPVATMERAAGVVRAAPGNATEHAAMRRVLERALDRRERPREQAACVEDRRMQRSRLAREIERAFLRPSNETKRSSFTLENGTRVHVQLRGSGERLQLVAVCAPSSRGDVAAALAQARYALARRGIVIDAQVR